MRRILRRRPLALASAGIFGAALCVSVAAQGLPPGPPDYFWPYGRVSVDGADVAPAQQPVVGIVRGRVCGIGETLVATAGPNVPPGDVGRTVYRVDILADGTRADQRPGCGRPGDPVMLYFPALRRFAVQQPTFVAGGQRVDLELGPVLPHRVINPMAAKDGVQ